MAEKTKLVWYSWTGKEKGSYEIEKFDIEQGLVLLYEANAVLAVIQLAPGDQLRRG